jgi:hypothetical protein
VRHEASRHLRNRKGKYRKDKINELETKSKNKNMWEQMNSRRVTNLELAGFFLIRIVGGGVQAGSTRHVGHWMAYCTCPGWLWICSCWWNEDWQGKPKYSEKTCPSATWSTTNPTCKTQARTLAAAVGSQRLTAWAMARPTCWIWGSDYEVYGFMGCNVVWFGESRRFRRNISPPSSGLNSKTSNKPAEAREIK